MPLLPPSVSPVSECSQAVKLQGQLTGATVDIFMDGVRVGSGTAAWADEVIPLAPGVTLQPGASITATQSLGDERSLPSAPVIVRGRSPIPPVRFVSHLWACGRCLFLEEVIPGAVVHVLANGAVRGETTAVDTTARVGLNQPLALHDRVQAYQIACGIKGPVTEAYLPDPPIPSGERRLPPPVVSGPLKACQRAVAIGQVREGSQVTLERTDGPIQQACFDLSGLWFPVNPPLREGEVVTARQTFVQGEGCGEPSPQSAPITVESTEPVPVPAIVGPLCAGGLEVTVTGMVPGARVRIVCDGSDELGVGEAPNVSFDFWLPRPLEGGSAITAQQCLCDIWSAPSDVVEVIEQPAALSIPVIPGPLVECATCLRLTHLTPGAAVAVLSTALSGPIASAHVYAEEAEITLWWPLIAQDRVSAVQIACGRTSDESEVAEVHGMPALVTPSVQSPLYAGAMSIDVTDVIPGATVDVYVNSMWRATQTATETSIRIYFPTALKLEDAVSARQRMCGAVTELGRPVVVAPPPPPSIAAFDPKHGQVGAAVTVNGAYFIDVTSVTIGDVASGQARAMGFAVLNDSTISAVVPNGAITGRLAVTTVNGTGTSTADFVVDSPPIPRTPPGDLMCEYVCDGVGARNSSTVLVTFSGNITPGSEIGPDGQKTFSVQKIGTLPAGSGQSITTVTVSNLQPGTWQVTATPIGASAPRTCTNVAVPGHVTLSVANGLDPCS